MNKQQAAEAFADLQKGAKGKIGYRVDQPAKEGDAPTLVQRCTVCNKVVSIPMTGDDLKLLANMKAFQALHAHKS